jgi:hypothetical protein
MKKHVPISALIMGGICALTLAAAVTPVSAGTAFLSHTGSGSACSQATPCASMASAITAAGANGEVICLDKGLYGNANITQSVTISCGDGLWESPIMPTTITTPAGADVVIEGLVGDGLATNGTSITMNGQGALHLRHVRLGNNPAFPGDGVFFEPNGPAKLHITDSVFYNNISSGVQIKPTGSGAVNVVLNRVQSENNGTGVTIDGTGGAAPIQVQIKDSIIANNNTGVSATSGTGLSVASLSNSHIVGNQTGAAASGSLAVVILDRTTVQANTVQALSSTGGSAIYSYGNNPINDNAALGASLTVIGLH